MKKVCIVGAGSSGLACLKECKDVGFDATCYEQSSGTGGLWRFRNEDIEGTGSVMKSTTSLTSKEMNAYSDFIPPKEFSILSHNNDLAKYFDAYVKKNDLSPFIKLNHRVIHIVPSSDYEKSGRWIVDVKNVLDDQESQETYDAVFLCNGYNAKPHIPTFPGQELFKGQILHTHSYKTPDPFKGKNIAVIGAGNSAVDAAVELSSLAKVYLSSRKGRWIVPRLGPHGLPWDMIFNRRWINSLMGLLPVSVICTFFEGIASSKFDHMMYGLRPRHRFLQQIPTMSDALPSKIATGEVIVKKGVKEFTESGIIFDGDNEVTPLDVIVLGTGYEVSYPFLDSSVVNTTTDNFVDKLYKFMFNPHLEHPETLVFIGLTLPIASLFPLAEIQSRWAVRVISGEIKLPSKEVMMKDIQVQKVERKFHSTPYGVAMIDWLQYMDDIAGQLGVNPNMVKLFFTDPILWYHVFFGPAVAYQYRLEGPGKWSGARQAILSVNDRIQRSFGRHEEGLTIKDRIGDSVGKFLFSIPFFIEEIRFFSFLLIMFVIVLILGLS